MLPRAVPEELSSQHRNKKSLKIGDGLEMNETELDVLQRLWNKGARKGRERGRARHAAQTASERQATSQWKSTRQCGAETPEERETRDLTEVQRYGTLNEAMKM